MKSAPIAEDPGRRAQAGATADFNRLAHLYRWMEWFTFGSLLWRCRCQFLSLLGGRQRALVIGDGDGRFTARLLSEDQRITVDAIDSSDSMLRVLSRRSASNAARLHTSRADARTFLPPVSGYDAIVTHFFLDCLTTEEVEDLARRLRGHCARHAVWIISEFAVPPGWYGRFLAAPLIATLYWAFRWLAHLSIRRLPDHRAALLRAGWSLEHQVDRLQGLLTSEQWSIAPVASVSG